MDIAELEKVFGGAAVVKAILPDAAEIVDQQLAEVVEMSATGDVVRMGVTGSMAAGPARKEMQGQKPGQPARQPYLDRTPAMLDAERKAAIRAKIEKSAEELLANNPGLGWSRAVGRAAAMYRGDFAAAQAARSAERVAMSTPAEMKPAGDVMIQDARRKLTTAAEPISKENHCTFDRALREAMRQNPGLVQQLKKGNDIKKYGNKA